MLNREQEYQPQIVAQKRDKFVVLSGCSGGGKSSLLAELGRRGFAIYEEPGRQVVKEQLLIGGDALPWDNIDLFLELTISRSIQSSRRSGAERYNRVLRSRHHRPGEWLQGARDRDPETSPRRRRTFSLSRDGVRRAALARDLRQRCGAPAQLRGVGRDVRRAGRDLQIFRLSAFDRTKADMAMRADFVLAEL